MQHSSSTTCVYMHNNNIMTCDYIHVCMYVRTCDIVSVCACIIMAPLGVLSYYMYTCMQLQLYVRT